jgi:hypothetical protein
LFPLAFFLVRFWAFLGKGSSKTPQKYVCEKSMSKTFSEKIKGISMSGFPRFFLFIAFSGVSQRWELKKHYKKRFAKRSCQKAFFFKSGQKSRVPGNCFGGLLPVIHHFVCH